MAKVPLDKRTVFSQHLDKIGVSTWDLHVRLKLLYTRHHVKEKAPTFRALVAYRQGQRGFPELVQIMTARELGMTRRDFTRLLQGDRP